MPNLIVVKATYDPEAAVWFTESADIPGLRLEGSSIEILVQKLPGAILDLLEEFDEDGGGEHCRDVPVELIASVSTRVRLASAA